MRKIGSILVKDELQHQIDALMGAAQIDLSWEVEDGELEIWILDDERLEEARELFASFMANPNAPEIQNLLNKGKMVLKEQKVENIKQEIREKKHRIVYSGQSTNVSKFIVLISGILFVLPYLNKDIANLIYAQLFLSINALDPWQSLMEGQLWRLFTPVLLHFGPLHILFNGWWMLDLGRMVEQKLGSLKYAGLLLIIAIPSHLVQGFFFGPSFGGLSGIVYGLLGYVWLRSKRDPRCGLFLHPQTMMFMMIWLLLGFGVLKNIANGVHVVGLLMGLLAAHIKTKLNR
jgi:GlpG protein